MPPLEHRERDAGYPASLRRILDDGEDFEAALGRAISFERSVLDAVAARIAHYEAMSHRALVIQMPERGATPTSRRATEADSA
jgi:hypothetical protein